jgi:Tol biopolymer transport system component
MFALTAATFVVGVLATLSPASAAPTLAQAKLSFVRGNSIFLAESNGSRISMVLRGRASQSYFDPAWSPNGHRVVCTVASDPFGTHGYYDVYVYEQSRRRVIVPGGDASPAWAPDGRRIVLISSTTGNGGQLYIARPGAGSRPVERNHNSELVVDNGPSWSPNGSAIAFSRRGVDNSSLSGLYLIGPDGRHLRRLVRGPAFNPSWSPESRRVAFDNGRAIEVINADGSGLRQLVPSGEDPAWSPDGRTIAFVHRGSVWLMSSSGAHAHLAVRNANQPTWKPR